MPEHPQRSERQLLLRRYADVLPADADDALLQVVADLDSSAQPYRRLEVPPALDRMADQLGRERPQPAPDSLAATMTPDQADRSSWSARQAEPIPLDTKRPRHRWFWEGLGMAAAIMVVVLFAGVLAIVLHGHDGQSGTTSGSSAGPPPPLPLTVTASGIPITLESIDTSSSSTRLTFTVGLPSDAVTVDASEVVILFPEDIQAKGITTNPRQTNMAGVPHKAGQPTTTFSITFGPVVHPDQGATLTFRKVRLQLTPLNQQAILGPWTFRITPTMLDAKAQPLPKPDRFGTYTNLSLAQARRLVAFSIAVPQPLPTELTTLDFNLNAAKVGSTSSAKANLVTIFYPARDPAEKGMSVMESTSRKVAPTVDHGTLHLLDWNGESSTIKLNSSLQTTVTIQGVTVTQLATQQGAPVIYYSWEHNGAFYVVYTRPGREVTDSVIRQFVANMIAPAGPNATPES